MRAIHATHAMHAMRTMQTTTRARTHCLPHAVTRTLLVVSWLTLACGGKPAVGVNGVTADDAIIYVKSNVRDAQLYIDGRFIAPLDALGGGVAVEPGPHRFELRHEDYFSSYLEIDLSRAERRKVAMNMAGILP
jgi:hypothetical protein